MILKAKERGDAPQLARYLLDQRDNEHVELHEVRGFISDDLNDAFGEAHAIAQGTRCQNYLFSMSFNPPEGENVSIEAFEKAIDQVEEKLGLQGQPRAVVFHEKDGRRHAHAVWSRIGSERMRSINISHYKVKLRDVSRELFLKVKAQNEREALEGLHRDRDEKDALIMRQFEERQALEREIRTQREAAQEELLQLREDVASYLELDRIDHTRSRKVERDGDGDDGPRPRPLRSRRRSFDP